MVRGADCVAVKLLNTDISTMAMTTQRIRFFAMSLTALCLFSSAACGNDLRRAIVEITGRLNPNRPEDLLPQNTSPGSGRDASGLRQTTVRSDRADPAGSSNPSPWNTLTTRRRPVSASGGEVDGKFDQQHRARLVDRLHAGNVWGHVGKHKVDAAPSPAQARACASTLSSWKSPMIRSDAVDGLHLQQVERQTRPRGPTPAPPPATSRRARRRGPRRSCRGAAAGPCAAAR
jgi:hypothetical protein